MGQRGRWEYFEVMPEAIAEWAEALDGAKTALADRRELMQRIGALEYDLNQWRAYGAIAWVRGFATGAVCMGALALVAWWVTR